MRSDEGEGTPPTHTGVTPVPARNGVRVLDKREMTGVAPSRGIGLRSTSPGKSRPRNWGKRDMRGRPLAVRHAVM